MHHPPEGLPMCTRSLVAIPDAEHGFRGRYVHWDGYPSRVGKALRTIVNRDGYATAVKTLTEDNYRWSIIDGRPRQDVGWQTDGRFHGVPGYGVAYTTKHEQCSPDEWHHGDALSSCCEWAYVLGENEISVYVSPTGSKWRQVGTVDYGDEAGMDRVMRDREPAW